MAELSRKQVDDLVEAAMEADGGCINCVSLVLAAFKRSFPDTLWASAIRRYMRTNSRAYSADEYIEAMDRG